MVPVVLCQRHEARPSDSSRPHVFAAHRAHLRWPHQAVRLPAAPWGITTEVASLPAAREFRKARTKRRYVFGIAAAIAALAALVPIAVLADDTTATSAAGVAADTVWVVVAAVFVMFMQAGFAMLEVGFSRMKNVGTVVAKVITNFSVASLVYWVVGFGIAFGAASPWLFPVIGFSGFVPSFSP